MTKAKILIIDKCWDCKWFTDNPPHCWEGKRNSSKQLNADIADAMVIDPGCLLPDAPEPITELISIEELEDISDGKDDLSCGHKRENIVYGSKRVYCAVCDKNI